MPENKRYEITLIAEVDEDAIWPDGTSGFLDYLGYSDAARPQSSADLVVEMITTRNRGLHLTLARAEEVAGLA